MEVSVLSPVNVANTGDQVLVFVADDPKNTFTLPPREAKRLVPENYRVQVDFTDPPRVIVIATIVYKPDLKKFDIEAVDGLKGARFVTNVDLEAAIPNA